MDYQEIIIASDMIKAKFERTKQFVMDVLKVKNPIIEHSSLRVSAALISSSSTYEIALTQEPTNRAGANDRYVDKANMFLGYEMALLLGKEKGGNIGGAFAIPYPDGGLFNSRPSSQVTEVDSLMNVYNGSVSVQDSDGTKLLLPRPTIDYLTVPQVQYVPFASGTPERLPEISQSAYKPFEPMLVVSGGKTTTLFLQTGNGDRTNIGGASGTQNVVMAHIKGFTCRNLADKYQLYLASLQS